MKRILALLAALMLFPAFALAEASVEQMRYDWYLDMLDENLTAKEDAGDRISNFKLLRSSFELLDNYQQARAFEQYISILLSIEEDYDEAESKLYALSFWKEFASLLESEEFKQQHPHIGSLKTLQNYLEARRQETAGNSVAADALFLQCGGFYDSAARMMNRKSSLDVLFDNGLTAWREGRLSEAAGTFRSLMAAGYKGADSIYLAIEAEAERKGMTLELEDKGENGIGATENISHVGAATVTQMPAVTAEPTKAAAAKPSVTPVPAWGSWSGWSANYVSENSNRQVQQKTQYRYRDTTYEKVEKGWSNWSAWTTTPASGVEGADYEKKVENKSTYKTVYTYTRYRYIGKNGNWWNAPKDYSGSSNYVRDGHWESKTTDSPLPKTGTAGGATLYDNGWYNQSTKEVVDTTTSVTYYRTRTRTYETVAKVGGWSSWSDSRPSSKEDREIDKRVVYRYRTR